MPKRSSIETLPRAVKEWLDKALVESNFSGYEALATELKKRGCDISRSAVHRYGQAFDERLRALKIAGEQAKALVDANPDDEGAMGEALMRLAQEKIFALLMEMQVDPKKANINSLGKTIAQIARASISQKKWAIEARARIDEKLKSLEAQAASKSGDKKGMDLETLKRVREEIYGIVQ